MRLSKAKQKLLLLAVLFCVSGALEGITDQTGYQNGYLISATAGDEDRAAFQVLGEFRVVVANILWSKVVDHYHHQYMATGGDWSKNKALLPILHTITELDPHFVAAYALMGGTILPRTGQNALAVTTLNEGIKNNPNSWELYRESALLFAIELNDPTKALAMAKNGLSHSNDEFSKNLMTRMCRTLAKRVEKGNSNSTKTSS